MISILLKQEKSKKLCDCEDYTLERYEIINLKLKIESNNSNSNPKKLLKKAYYYFKLKNLKEALTTTQYILAKVKKTEYPIIYSIAQENIFILEKMWLGNDEFEEKRKKIKLPNENEIIGKGINSIIGYIKYSKFFDYKFYNAIEDLEKIKNRYDTHEGIGHSFLSDIDNNNIFRWYEVLNFMSDNGLFFDYYVNIKRLAKITFKQNIYALKDRVIESYVDSYIFRTTLPYLSIKEYKDCFYELGVQELNFNVKGVKDIFRLFDNILSSYTQANQPENNHDYYKHYIETIKKIAFLLGYIKFSKEKTNSLILRIFNIYKLESRERGETVFDSLIGRRVKVLQKRNALIYISYLFKGGIDYSFSFRNLFTVLENFKSIKLNNIQLEILLSDGIENNTNYYRAYILYKLYTLGNKGIKFKVLEKTYEILDDKKSFDIKIYDIFTKEKVISISQKYYKVFYAKVYKEFNSERQVHYSNETDGVLKNLMSLNKFIDHVYIFYKDPYNYLKQFLNRSSYYNFLISPEGLEIQNFNIHWFYIAYIRSYFTLKYIMINHKDIRSHISEKVLKSENNKYYQAYINLMIDIHD